MWARGVGVELPCLAGRRWPPPHPSPSGGGSFMGLWLNRAEPYRDQGQHGSASTSRAVPMISVPCWGKAGMGARGADVGPPCLFSRRWPPPQPSPSGGGGFMGLWLNRAEPYRDQGQHGSASTSRAVPMISFPRWGKAGMGARGAGVGPPCLFSRRWPPPQPSPGRGRSLMGLGCAGSHPLGPEAIGVVSASRVVPTIFCLRWGRPDGAIVEGARPACLSYGAAGFYL